MAAMVFFGLRRSLVAALVIALSIAGLGRALAAADHGGIGVPAIAGIAVPICHAGTGKASTDPARPASHDCCDDGALLAAAVLPAPSVLDGPAPVAAFADRAPALASAPPFARPRDPRLSRGPPAA